MKLSVICPVYNTEKYLRTCLESIQRQTLNDFEVLLVDDGSTDASSKICDDFCNNDLRFKCVHKENGGVSAARNMGLSIATGKYVFFADSDDYLEQTAFENLFDAAEKNQSEIVCGSYRICRGQKRREVFLDEGPLLILRKTDMQGWFFLWNKLFLRSFLCDSGIRFREDIKISEDGLFIFQLLMRTTKIYCIKSIVYNYLLRAGSAMGALSLGGIQNQIIVNSELEKEIALFDVRKTYEVFIGKCKSDVKMNLLRIGPYMKEYKQTYPDFNPSPYQSDKKILFFLIKVHIFFKKVRGL